MPNVNPHLLVWARETADLSREKAVKKLQFGDAHGIAAVDRLAALESGTSHPTRSMLVKMSKQYRRPLVTFYLEELPRKSSHGADFRTLSGDGLACSGYSGTSTFTRHCCEARLGTCTIRGG